MNINELLSKTKISKYRLSKNSNIPYATISDLCSGKTSIEKCTGETLYKLAKALNVTMESLVEFHVKEEKELEYRCSFETFKSNICHRIKDVGDMDFIIETLEADEIRKLYNKEWYPESLYLLAMVDYLSRENNIPVCTNYNDLRGAKLKNPIYPASIIAASVAMQTDQVKKESWISAIPEFKRFNIVENEVRNVY